MIEYRLSSLCSILFCLAGAKITSSKDIEKYPYSGIKAILIPPSSHEIITNGINKNGKTKKIAGVGLKSILVFLINFLSNFSVLFNQLILIIFHKDRIILCNSFQNRIKLTR